jgi:hypothetical protein
VEKAEVVAKDDVVTKDVVNEEVNLDKEVGPASVLGANPGSISVARAEVVDKDDVVEAIRRTMMQFLIVLIKILVLRC